MHAISGIVVLLLFCTFCHAKDISCTHIKWTECSQTCGEGVHFRRCRGGYQMRSCGVLPKCPIDGGWSPWFRWTRCSQTCGSGGTRRRIRVCKNPRPQYKGDDCKGDRVEYGTCGVLPMCPVDGGWGNWSDWSVCTARLCRLHGYRYRSRECDNPPPRHGGRPCEGGTTFKERCWRENCPNRNITALNILWPQKGNGTDFSSVNSITEPEGTTVPPGLEWSSSDSKGQVDCGSSSSSDCENAPQPPPAQQTTPAPTTAPTPAPEVVWSNDGDSSSSSSEFPNENLENRPPTTKKATATADDENWGSSSSSSAYTA